MVFIVEMRWGRPPGLTMMHLDEDGNECSVFYPNENPDLEWRSFDCSGGTWEVALDLALCCGWEPLGVQPANPSDSVWNSDYAKSLLKTYKPESYPYSKHLIALDALNLSYALERVQWELSGDQGLLFAFPRGPRVLTSWMDEASYTQINRGISETFLTEFIIFLKKGAFNYCWDD